MLEIFVPGGELFNEKTLKMSYPKDAKLQLEHSLISLKKWEQKYHKPFLGTSSKAEEHTDAEMYDYIRCMTINTVDDDVYDRLTTEQWLTIIKYIKDSMTATWFSDNKLVGASKNSKEVITAEIIYYWMIELGIPVEFQKWHLNQLLTLIKVVSVKRQPAKKMDTKEAAAQRQALNRARRAKYHTKG